MPPIRALQLYYPPGSAIKVVSPTYFGPHGRQLSSATAAVATAVRQQGGIVQAARWLSSLLDRGCEPQRGSKSLRLLRGRALWAGAAWLQALIVATRSSCTSTEVAALRWRLQNCRWVKYGISGAAVGACSCSMCLFEAHPE